jgi:N-acetylneuraminic acid mutarotase
MCASALLSFAAVTAADPVEVRFNLPAVAVANSWAAAASIGDNIYVIGGSQGYVVDIPPTLSIVQIYDVMTGDTTIGAPMWKGVSGAGYGAGPDGKVYIAGGWNATDGDYYQRVQIYDPVADNWSLAASTIPSPIGRSASAMSPDGILYVFGGGFTSNVTMIYNTAMDVWSYGQDQPAFGYDGRAIWYNSTAVFVFGGSSGSHDSVRIYNPVANSWSTGTPSPIISAYGGAVLARNGYIYIFGGSSNGAANDLNPVNSVLRYSPIDDTWEFSTAVLSSGRDSMTVVVDTYGRAVVVGGYSGSVAVATVDAFTTSELTGLNMIQISSPSDGSIVSGVIDVQVQKVNGGASTFVQVDLYVDGALFESRFLTASTTFLWNTSGLTDGSVHNLMARGYNNDGTVVDASVTVTVSSLSVEEELAAIMTQLSSLQAQLNIPDANLTALGCRRRSFKRSSMGS